ncbi:MAG TPA: CHAT domain-containing protein [Dermatophilaceae bacterium]|nr:CHAT domain-containing protein [Dermatophilaceae bacterium]
MEYLDFDVVIEPREENLRTRVQASPFGMPEWDFVFPFSDEDFEQFIRHVGPTRSDRRLIGTAGSTDVQEFGSQLFAAAFGGQVGVTLQRSLDEARRQQMGLRLRLRIAENSAMQEVPWEFLYSEGWGRYLAMSVRTPLVRFIDLPEPVEPLRVVPPLRVLVSVSQPAGVQQLQAADEVAKLHQATAQLQADGMLELAVEEHTSFGALLRQLNRAQQQGRPVHVLHFIGHGTFDRASGAGALVLEDDHGGRRDVTGHDLAMVLHDYTSLRLAVLNTCEGARTSRRNPFGGVAQSLVRQGVPAVLAMQFPVTDVAARNFAEEFYTELAFGSPVDTATAKGRQAVFATDNAVEWATPVLYLRSPDGHVFDLPAPQLEACPAPVAPQPQVVAAPAQPDAAAGDPPAAGPGGAPFTVGTPIVDPRQFFGRYAQVRRILGKLRVPPLQNTAIVGPRRSGKTSMLRHLRDLAQVDRATLRPTQQGYVLDGFAGHRFLTVDFQHPGYRTREGLTGRLLQQLGVDPGGPVGLAAFYDAMTEHLNRPTVVLMDEVGVAMQRYGSEFDDEFWDALRSLASSDAGRNLAFVLATHDQPYVLAAVNNYASPFFNIIGYTAELRPFTEEEALELVAGSPVPLPEPEVRWALAASQGWPVVLQVLCRELTTAVEDGGPDPGWRDRALEQAHAFTMDLPGFGNPP